MFLWRPWNSSDFLAYLWHHQYPVHTVKMLLKWFEHRPLWASTLSGEVTRVEAVFLLRWLKLLSSLVWRRTGDLSFWLQAGWSDPYFRWWAWGSTTTKDSLYCELYMTFLQRYRSDGKLRSTLRERQWPNVSILGLFFTLYLFFFQCSNAAMILFRTKRDQVEPGRYRLQLLAALWNS